MTLYAHVHMINHGIDKLDVGQVFTYKSGKLFKLSSEEGISKPYADWTIITNVIDADNFECFSGEMPILNLAINIPKNDKEDAYKKTCDYISQINKEDMELICSIKERIETIESLVKSFCQFKDEIIKKYIIDSISGEIWMAFNKGFYRK